MRKPIIIIFSVVALLAAGAYFARRAPEDKAPGLPAATAAKPAVAWQTRDTHQEAPQSDAPDPAAATPAAIDGAPEPLPLEQDPAALAEMRAVMPDLRIISKEEADAMPRPEDIVAGDGTPEEPVGYQLSEEEIRNYPMPVTRVNAAGDATGVEQAPATVLGAQDDGS